MLAVTVIAAASANGEGMRGLAGSDTTVPTSSTAVNLATTLPETTIVATTMPATSTSDSIAMGLGSQDASSDVEVISCGKPDAIGFSYPRVKVTNLSSKPSDYMITVVLESKNGTVKYGDSLIFINRLMPGQTSTEDGMPVSDVPTIKCAKVLA